MKFDPRLGEEIENRRRAVQKLREWVRSEPWTHRLTLNFNARRGISDTTAEKRFHSFMAELDRYLFGPNYYSRRTEAVGFQENISTNRHIHTMMKVPHSKTKKANDVVMMSIWRSVQPGGTAYLESARDPGAADYCTKQLWMPGNYDRVLFNETSEEDCAPRQRVRLPTRALFR